MIKNILFDFIVSAQLLAGVSPTSENIQSQIGRYQMVGVTTAVSGLSYKIQLYLVDTTNGKL